MTKETLLITGATGMIGFRTLIFLLEQGHFNIRVAVRSESSYEKLLTYKPIIPYVSQLESVIVPDITLPGAYDEAVKGATHIVHVASPIPSRNTKDYETDLIQPAIQGTVGILQSAHKAGGVKKIVITASVAAITSSTQVGTGATINEETRTADVNRPFAHAMVAYGASKALSFQATDDFISTYNPSFVVVRILPSFVIGRDDTVTDVSEITKGTNGNVMGPLLGRVWEGPISGGSVHIDDVAKLHALALDASISGNELFLASNPVSIEWAEAFDIVKRRYPGEYAAGLFKFDSARRPESGLANIDSSKATKTFGIQFKNFEEQVTSVVDHYLELAKSA
ncbi:hypothetical protein NLG97_g2405 [Lecanicillium saksenae]|uniref:Uncharacterized protein n=1 Tax=Lecanicillium saksenae TaxID=468837 RepID=A0ACC1R114_9HYPO|nr:hypothetical protein NLG97_g2405 [Lecanicillium saksenae]